MKKMLKRIITDFPNGTLPDFKSRQTDVPLDLDKLVMLPTK